MQMAEIFSESLDLKVPTTLVPDLLVVGVEECKRGGAVVNLPLLNFNRILSSDARSGRHLWCNQLIGLHGSFSNAIRVSA